MLIETINELVQRLQAELEYGNKRAAAEYAYALTVRLRDEVRLEEAQKYAMMCLQLLEELPSETLDDVVSQRLSIGGVQIPELLHDDVVRARFEAVLPFEAVAS